MTIRADRNTFKKFIPPDLFISSHSCCNIERLGLIIYVMPINATRFFFTTSNARKQREKIFSPLYHCFLFCKVVPPIRNLLQSSSFWAGFILPPFFRSIVRHQKSSTCNGGASWKWLLKFVTLVCS